MRAAIVGWGLVAAFGLAAGCRTGGAADTDGGARLNARWTGADTSSLDAPATAEWCDSLRALEIVAMAGDTGIGIVLYPRDSLVPGDFPVRPPAAADSVPPSAAVGLRWFSQTAVRGFQGDSGRVSLTRSADGALSGRFRATAHAISGDGRLTVTGTFNGLRRQPATRGCVTAPPRRPAALPDSEEGVD